MKTCLSLLLLLLGFCQAQPPVGEEKSVADVLEDNEDMDIITDILISNNDSNEILLEGDLSQDQPLVGEESVDDVLEDNEDMDISTRILISNNGSNEILLEGDLLLPTTRNAMKCFRNNCLWKKSSNGLVTIPYTVSRAYTSAERSRIVSAMQSFHRTTCIRFVPRRNQKDHISVQSGGGCYSSLGRTGGRQVLSLRRSGCMNFGIMQHELNHALGFNHEQTRSDRDRYVRINWKNINRRSAYNFNRKNTNNLNTPYDYTSIMHYGRRAFSINGRDSITPIPNSRVRIGQRRGMTRNDILRINRLYRC
uniref:Metalloendopeptidase n=1 Tax=Gadus morhua TaxID=8049 RepID=A0A8C5FSC2_GADMO